MYIYIHIKREDSSDWLDGSVTSLRYADDRYQRLDRRIRWDNIFAGESDRVRKRAAAAAGEALRFEFIASPIFVFA